MNLFCVIGKSGSGKDSVCRQLLKKTNLHFLVTYTSRPIRPTEENGKEYFFVDEEFIKTSPLVIERRVYKTVNGDWYYATLNDGQFKAVDSIMITSPQQYLSIKHFFENSENVHIIPLYIYVDDGIRLQRLISREMLQEKPNYLEICRRYKTDEEDFKLMEPEKRFLNYSLSECVSEILNEINLRKDKT